MSCITEGSTGYPGGNGNIPFENGFLSEMLLQHGYNTYAVGKWHLTPADQISAAGPYDRWPLGRGFERYYGFLGGETNQWFPDLTYDTLAIADGEVAMLSYAALSGMDDEAEKKKICRDLLEYCRLDTLAMVRIWEKLSSLTQPKEQLSLF